MKNNWLVLGISDAQAWAFPFAHLVRVAAQDRQLEVRQLRTGNGKIELKFPVQEIEVRTLYPRKLLEAILAGRAKHLATGPQRIAEEGSIAKLHEQTPSDHYQLAPNPILTGEILPVDK